MDSSRKNKIVRGKNAHESCIFCVKCIPKRTLVLANGRNIHEQNIKCYDIWQLYTRTSWLQPDLRTLCTHRKMWSRVTLTN